MNGKQHDFTVGHCVWHMIFQLHLNFIIYSHSVVYENTLRRCNLTGTFCLRTVFV